MTTAEWSWFIPNVHSQRKCVLTMQYLENKMLSKKNEPIQNNLGINVMNFLAQKH